MTTSRPSRDTPFSATGDAPVKLTAEELVFRVFCDYFQTTAELDAISLPKRARTL
jgi:hypothetical protein